MKAWQFSGPQHPLALVGEVVLDIRAYLDGVTGTTSLGGSSKAYVLVMFPRFACRIVVSSPATT